MEPDTGDPPTTHDRTFRHRIDDGVDPVLKAMNRINRGTHVRDAGTVTSTLIRHRPMKGQRLELQGPNEWGTYDLVLISWSPSDTMWENPRGSNEDLDESDQSDTPAEAWVSGTAGKPGEHDLPMPTLRGDSARFRDSAHRDVSILRSMNQANARFW